MLTRIGLGVAILTIMTGASGSAAAPEIGATQDNAYGIEGFTLTRIAQPVYGWWPGDVEYYEFTYKKGDVDMEGVLVKPPTPDGSAKLPGVVLNHGGGGNARESGMEYGWQMAVRGFVGIACDYTHTKFSRTPQGQPAAGPGSPEGSSVAGTGIGQPWNNETNFNRALAEIDILQHLPFVNQDRIYMYGHSMGGFLTIAMTTKTDKIKAAANTGAGLGHPVGPDESVVPEMKSPFLVMAGSEDKTVDVTYSVKLFDDLRKNKIDTKLIVFEGQPHQVHAYRAADVFDAAAAWFNAHP